MKVDVWLTHPHLLSDEGLLRDYERLLNREERERRDRFIVPKKQQEFLIARALLRTSLSRYAKVDPDAWDFELGEYGKPRIKSPRHGELHFNLSHTEGLIACAVCAEGELGIDVEDHTRLIAHLNVARSTFAPAEVRTLERCDAAALPREFFRVWTLKEAYIKARGEGFGIPLDQFWFDPDALPIRLDGTSRGVDTARTWHFMQAFPTPDHVLALAASAEATLEIHSVVPMQS